MLVRNNIFMCLAIEIGKFFRIPWVMIVQSKRYFALTAARSTMLTLTSKLSNFFFSYFFSLAGRPDRNFFSSLFIFEIDSRVFGTLSTFQYLFLDAWLHRFTLRDSFILEQLLRLCEKRKV